jgi:hypothetical protein
MTTRTSETSRQTYIRLLLETEDKAQYLAGDEHDGMLSGELVKEGYLSGTAVQNATGRIVGAGVAGITAKGRLFLQTLQRQEDDESTSGRIKKHAGIVGAYLFGLLSPVLTDLIKALGHWVGLLSQ